MKNIYKILLLLAVIVGGYFFLSLSPDQEQIPVRITSYEDCVQAGYPVLETYPEQCRTPEGQTFTRELNEKPEAARQTVQLYYYNASLDEDETGNILCSENGLVAVERTIPVTQTPIQDTIELLLRGEISQQEEVEGITTEYPLEGFELTGASLEKGVLTLGFSDPQHLTRGGSCRTGILWLQIAQTAKQFDVVEDVQFQPEDLFQP